MLRLRDAVDAGIARLTPTVGTDAHSDAFVLLAFATGRQIASLRLNLDDEIKPETLSIFESAVAQRLKFQPISQIIGYREFWKHRFKVTPSVLDPRPDTETLVEQALELGPFKSIVDLGTGSGCILLSLLSEWPSSLGVGIDASDAALDVARDNAGTLFLTSRTDFRIGNWCDGIPERFDLVVSNPPYITERAMDALSRDVKDWEPRIALTPEGDGLDAYRAISNGAKNILNPNGVLLLEIGFDQGTTVTQMLMDHGFFDVHLHQDINGKDRVVSARLAPL